MAKPTIDLTIINIKELIDSNSAVTQNDGNVLYEEVIKIINNHKIALLNFSGIVLITCIFLQVSIGQLYGKYDENFLKKHLIIANIDEDSKKILKKVESNAIEYFRGKNKCLE